MLDEEVLYIKRRMGNVRVLGKRADFRSRRSDHPHICVQTEMMPDVIPPRVSLRAQGSGTGSPLCHAHCGELREIMLTVPLSEAVLRQCCGARHR